MKNKKTFLLPGFSLFELVIGLLISTILTTICFAIYQQITRSTQFVQKITNSDTKAMILKNRLQQDLIGISPLWFTPANYDAITKKATAPEAGENKEDKPKESKEVKEDNDSFFYATDSKNDNGINLFSFITTSGMQMYGSENKMYVRVVYSVKKNPHLENNFSLYRKEMEPESFFMQTASTDHGSYEIASGVKKIFTEYGFIDTKKTDEKGPVEITWLKSWQAKEEKPEEKKQKPLLPKFVKIKIVFIEEKTLREQEYEFLFTIPIDATVKYRSFIQKNQPQETQLSTPAQMNDDSSTSSKQPPNSNKITVTIHPSQAGSEHAT